MRRGGPLKNPQLAALWLTNPQQAAESCRAALKEARTVGEAAKKLGIGRQTLFRWLKRPELEGARQ